MLGPIWTFEQASTNGDMKPPRTVYSHVAMSLTPEEVWFLENYTCMRKSFDTKGVAQNVVYKMHHSLLTKYCPGL